MKDHIIYYSKLAAIAIISWLLIAITGLISYGITFVTGILMMIDEIEISGSFGHASEAAAYMYIVMAFVQKPMECLMLTFIFISPGIIFALANKYTLSQIIHWFLRDKSETLLEPTLDKVIQKIKANEPGILKKSADYALIKLKLIHQLKEASENKIQKRVLTYGLKKAKLDDVDFSDENLDFNQVIKTKTISALQTMTKPSLKWFLIVLGLQWLFMIIIYFTC